LVPALSRSAHREDLNVSTLGIPNLREALASLASMGATVLPIRRTGELRVRHPALPKPVTVSGHRKDSPRHLLKALRLVQRSRRV
jgi:hypothetical protein